MIIAYESAKINENQWFAMKNHLNSSIFNHESSKFTISQPKPYNKSKMFNKSIEILWISVENLLESMIFNKQVFKCTDYP